MQQGLDDGRGAGRITGTPDNVKAGTGWHSVSSLVLSTSRDTPTLSAAIHSFGSFHYPAALDISPTKSIQSIATQE